MLTEYLERNFAAKKLYNSLLITADDLFAALEELRIFIHKVLFKEILPLDSHHDFLFISTEQSGSEINARSITIDQIRSAKNFIYKTPAIAQYKVVLIYKAELMNINAANACLKILEDTPRDSYIFLLAGNSASLPATIKSRCAKIHVPSTLEAQVSKEYYKHLQWLLLTGTVEGLSGITNANKELWKQFCNNALYLLARLIKFNINPASVTLLPPEEAVNNKLKLAHTSSASLLNKYEAIRILLANSIEYDLDLKCSFIVILSYFSEGEGQA